MNIHDFRAKIGNLAKGNRFKVNIVAGPPGSGIWNPFILRDFEFMASDVVMAGRTLEVEPYRYWGPSFSAPNQTDAHDFSVTFYNDATMSQLRFFHSWMDFIHGNGTYDFNFMNEYTTTVNIQKYTDTDPDKPVFTFIYKKAYPVTIQDVPLAWADEEILKTTVNFTYVDYDIVQQ
jgi:hypothetical protein